MCSPVRASQIAHALKLPRVSVVRIDELGRALKRRVVAPAAGKREGPQYEHQIVGANEGARIDRQKPSARKRFNRSAWPIGSISSRQPAPAHGALSF